MMVSVYKEDGSITIFMTFIFLLLFALTGATLDSARYFSSGGYVRSSAYGADIAIYGEYNRELYTEYGLFGCGGFNGKGESDWLDRYQEILQENLRERPDKQEQGILPRRYASVYQINDIRTELEEVHFLTEEKYFRQQLRKWIAAEGLKDLGGDLVKQVLGTDQGKKEELLKDLEKTDSLEETKEAEQAKNSVVDKGVPNNTGRGQQKPTVENPLEFLRKLLQDGVLSLVCDTGSLCEREIDTREVTGEMQDAQEGLKPKGTQSWTTGKSGLKILKKFLKQEDSMWNDEMTVDSGKKGELIIYVTNILESYVSEHNGSVPYGLEYLISGKKSQKEAFGAVINHLFLIRTMTNFLYVEKDPVLQAQSLETATALAAPLMAEAFIPVIQKGILMVLSMEEACVDITALLQGRRVPVFKSRGSFQMQYAQICLATRKLFVEKAKSFPKEGDRLIDGNGRTGLGYTQYLWLMLMMQSWDELYQRTLDIVQFDLRERFNQTFTLDHCICRTRVVMTYDLPVLFNRLVDGKNYKDRIKSKNSTTGMLSRQITVTYGYS